MSVAKTYNHGSRIICPRSFDKCKKRVTNERQRHADSGILRDFPFAQRPAAKQPRRYKPYRQQHKKCACAIGYAQLFFAIYGKISR